MRLRLWRRRSRGWSPTSGAQEEAASRLAEAESRHQSALEARLRRSRSWSPDFRVRRRRRPHALQRRSPDTRVRLRLGGADHRAGVRLSGAQEEAASRLAEAESRHQSALDARRRRSRSWSPDFRVRRRRRPHAWQRPSPDTRVRRRLWPQSYRRSALDAGRPPSRSC